MKKFIISLITLTIVLSSTVVAFAYPYWNHPSNANYVQLYSNKKYAFSESKRDPHMYYEGENTSSNHKVYFQMQYSPDKKSWKDDVYLLASPNTIVGSSQSHNYDSRPYWRLQLDTYGAGTGGTAYGWTW